MHEMGYASFYQQASEPAVLQRCLMAARAVSKETTNPAPAPAAVQAGA